MKSHETVLLGLYTALIEDVRRYYPEDAVDLGRDLSRLQSLVEARGSKFFTIDLVAAGKHFDLCLSVGTFTPSGLPCQGPRRRGAIPKLFSGMLLKVFDLNGELRSNIDPQSIFFLRQLYYAAKKVEMECDPQATFNVVREFFDVEANMRRPTLQWDSDILDDGIRDYPSFTREVTDPCREQLSLPFPGIDPGLAREDVLPDWSVTLQRVADVVAVSMGEVPWTSLRPHHGPGAVSDSSWFDKYQFSNWPEKLQRCFPKELYAFANENQMETEEDFMHFSVHEPPSKLIAVPKTQKAPRLIASEPCAHQWIQQGVGDWIRSQLSATPLNGFIHFRDQKPSQDFALQASATGLGCTIDLSSASDRLSCWCVERIFRANRSLLYALHSCRTRWVVNNIDSHLPKYLLLKKFAPMGSATTFPVQSIVYTIVALAASIYNAGGTPNQRDITRLIKDRAGTIVVFGDDICCPTADYLLVTEILSYLGLAVNVSKSFAVGNFREACGVDGYKGVSVTPVYFRKLPVESDPKSVVSAIDSSNNFHKEGLWVTAKWIADSFPILLKKRISIEPVGSGDLAFHTFSKGRPPRLFEVWDNDLQCWKRRTLQLRVAEKRHELRGERSLLQYFTEEPSQDQEWSAGITNVRKVTYRSGWIFGSYA